jgi:hypothetical protein
MDGPLRRAGGPAGCEHQGHLPDHGSLRPWTKETFRCCPAQDYRKERHSDYWLASRKRQSTARVTVPSVHSGNVVWLKKRTTVTLAGDVIPRHSTLRGVQWLVNVAVPIKWMLSDGDVTSLAEARISKQT